MSDKLDADPRLQIKKYPNRRFYDATHSRHVTLSELYDLICAGQDVLVRDAKTGDDITNVILTQIILERDAHKLSIFPANILHQVIRTQHQFLGGVVEQYFRQTVDAYRTSQERWEAFLRNTLGATIPGVAAPPPGPPTLNPFDWTNAWMKSLIPGAAARPSEPPTAPPSGTKSDPAEVAELRRQLGELTRRIEQLAADRK